MRLDYYADTLVSTTTRISIIIAVRNEEKNIKQLLNSLSIQTYPKDFFEIIIINDHSSDKTLEILENVRLENLKIIELNDSEIGKKTAIDKGISVASGEIIITTDGDCTFGENWLTTIVSFYEKEKPDMMIAPVTFEKKFGFLNQFQFYDFMALQASTAGACSINIPIMNNGANLIYKKQAYLDLQNATKKELASGDDMFLLINLKKNKKQIRYLNSFDALVTTKSEHSIPKFIHQRIRWAGKNKNHADVHILTIGLIVFLFNLSLLSTAILAYWLPNVLFPLALLFITKTIIEYILISLAAATFRKKLNIYVFFFFQVFHIIYTSIIPFLSVFSTYKWKGRRI